MPNLIVRGDRIDGDEILLVDGIPVTTPARTALDLGCWYSMTESIAAIDDLCRATDLKLAEVETLIDRYAGRRGVHMARTAIGLADPGAQSPKETWLRLVLIRAGLPRPETQIAVQDDFGDTLAYLDMGWEEVKVAVEYDGEQHRNDRRQYTWDIRRLEMLERRGWIVVRIVAGDRPAEVVRRVRAALARRASR
jgi:Protein of unknown function (DUF559)